MLPFKNRLTKRKDHEKVQRLGDFFSANNIAIKVLKNNTQDVRVGIVVGIKFSKKAVERNLAKRAMRDAIHTELKNLKKGFDVVVMARKKDEEKTKNINFKKDIFTVLKKGSLLMNTEKYL